MSILQLELSGSRVVDLFAGSGSLGLEALSRGSVRADFVETDRSSIEAIRANIAALGLASRSRIIIKDASRFARKLERGAYDLAFADPPFRSDHASQLLDIFRETPFARILGIEHRANLPLEGDRTEVYGDVAITFCFAP